MDGRATKGYTMKDLAQLTGRTEAWLRELRRQGVFEAVPVIFMNRRGMALITDEENKEKLMAHLRSTSTDVLSPIDDEYMPLAEVAKYLKKSLSYLYKVVRLGVVEVTFKKKPNGAIVKVLDTENVRKLEEYLKTLHHGPKPKGAREVYVGQDKACPVCGKPNKLNGNEGLCGKCYAKRKTPK